MSRHIGIIGLGHVGVTTAYTMVTKGLADTLTLIDTLPGRAEAEGLDLTDAFGGLPTTPRLLINDYASLKQADLVIFAAGDISQVGTGGDRNGETASTKKAIDEAAPQLVASGFNGVLLDISNPCDVAVNYWQQKLSLPREQIIGTGTGLDTYRMRRAVAAALDVNVASVHGYNLGEHGASQFTAWSTVFIDSTPIADFPNVAYDQLAEEARQGGVTIFMNKHYTCFGIATIACEMANAILADAHKVFPCACWDEAYGISIGHLATIGKLGVIDNPTLALTPEETALYAESAATIKVNLQTMNQSGGARI